MKKEIVLTIGGFDPSGEAGVLADHKIFKTLKVPSAHVLTAVTAQNAKKFLSWEPVSQKSFSDQLKSIFDLYDVKIVKLGMLADLNFIPILLTYKKQYSSLLIWDPVLISSTGKKLIKTRSFSAPLRRLLQACDLITPNCDELKWILGGKIIRDWDQAAVDLLALSHSKEQAVLLKGGHLKGDARDRLYWNDTIFEISAKKIAGNFHGTGCTFASLIAAYCFKGKNFSDAFFLSKNYMMKYYFIK